MIAINFIELMLFIGFPVVFISVVIFGVWIERGTSNTAVKLRQQHNSPRHTGTYGSDKRNYKLDSEMQEYYENKNFDRRIGKG